MARTRTPRAQNRRGSPEAIEKRRVARAFNDLLGGRGASSAKIDGRTEKRRARLLKELQDGKSHGGRELKPIDVLQHVQELLVLGQSVASIKKVRRVPRPVDADQSKVALVKRLHEAYGFRKEVYRFVGIGDDSLTEAGVLGGAKAPRRRAGRRKKA